MNAVRLQYCDRMGSWRAFASLQILPGSMGSPIAKNSFNHSIVPFARRELPHSILTDNQIAKGSPAENEAHSAR